MFVPANACLFILEIVFKIISEVIFMEDTDVRGREMSGGFVEFRETERTSEGERRNQECYKRCMEDAWDVKGESTCSSACGFEV